MFTVRPGITISLLYVQVLPIREQTYALHVRVPSVCGCLYTLGNLQHHVYLSQDICL